MKLFKQTFLSVLLAAGFFSVVQSSVADESPSFNRYTQAKLKVVYEGEVGDLLQAISSRLGIAYLNHKTDFSKTIKVSSNEPISVQALLDDIKKQVPNLEIKFEKVGESVLLVVFNPSSPIKLRNEQFISDVVFADEKDDEVKMLETKEVELDKVGNQLEIILPEKIESESENEEMSEAQKKTVNNTSEPQIESKIESAGQDPASKALNELVTRTTDEKRIAKYKKKKAPKYKVAKSELSGLTGVKVTPIGSFLIFDKAVDTQELTVVGKFEAVAQYGNVIAISHEKWASPKKIEIINKQNKRLVLEKVGK